MQLLRKIASFGASQEDMKYIYTLFVRSSLEYSSSVWHRNITFENETDLERVQKSAFRLVLGNKYISYKNTIDILGMETLKDRRETLFKRLAINSLEVEQMKTILKENTNILTMETRNQEKYHIFYSNIDRYKKSAEIQMQYHVNENR